MSRTITSPVKRWPGTVTLADPLSYPQVYAFRDAITAMETERDNGGDPFRVMGAWVPGILACVEAWNLEGLNANMTVDTFPATPPRSAGSFLDWLVSEIAAAFQEAEEVPNG